MKTYGIDLDGCCYDFINCFGAWLESRVGIKYNYEDVTDYYWFKNIDGLSEDVFWDEFNEFTYADMYRGIPVLDDTKKAIKTLAKNGELVFVTARPMVTRHTTNSVIYRDFDIESDKVYFSKDKDDAVKNIKIDVFVEDGPHYAEAIAQNTNAKVYLMDAPYNKQANHPQITRVRGWQHILELEGLNNGA